MRTRPKLPKRKGGRKPKAKGSAFERTTCRQLSLWISHGQSEDLLWRSSTSGGRATRKPGAQLATQCGDIAAIDPAGHRFTDLFYVECKCYNSLRLDQLFYTQIKSVFRPIWKRCASEALRYSKLPWVIAKENCREPLVFMDRIPPEAWHEVISCFGCALGGVVYVLNLNRLLAFSPEVFFALGERSYANDSHGGLTLNGTTSGQLSMGLSGELANEAADGQPNNSGRSNRRQRPTL